MLEQVEAARLADPRQQLFEVVKDQSLPSAQRYFAMQRAERGGLDLRSNKRAALTQYYANMATFVGDYALAGAIYLQASGPPQFAGHIHAREAIASLLPLTGNRQAVFINESHAQPDTRAVTFGLLAPLRAQGFDTLALEDLGVEAAPPGACGRSIAADRMLASRGYPASDREEAMATTLSCLFKARPETRLLTLAGFAHISEAPTHALTDGGMMAYRFKTKTGIDPLTVDTTTLLHADPTGLLFNDQAFSASPGSPTSVGAYVLADAEGKLLGNSARQYDISVFVPAAVNRDAAPNWLALGGARTATLISAVGCGDTRPCLVDVHDAFEGADGLPQDRCVITEGGQSCRLFLANGVHRVQFFDEQLAMLGEQQVTVKGGR